MVQVIKRNKTQENFDEGKVRQSVISAAREVNATEKDIVKSLIRVVSEIKDLIKNKEIVDSQDIRQRVLLTLDKIQPKVSAAWRKFDKRKPSRR